MRLVIVLLIPSLWAADPIKLPEPFHSIADLAAAAPPEFTADALLRMVESGKLADKNARLQLIEQAFQLAASAKFPVRMQGLAGTTTDTASGSLSQAYDLKLDALTLQSRAVEDMLPLDPSRARELFGQIVKPTLAPLTCDDALVYEPSEYYRALSAVVNGGFTPKEKAKDEPFNLMQDAVGLATSPSQLAPLARAIQSAAVTATQRQMLWVRFGGLLDSIQPDQRSFGAALVQVTNLGASEVQAAIDKFQGKSRGCETDAANASTDAAKKNATPKLDRYWQSPAAQKLLEAGKTLRFASNTQTLSAADRATPQWQQQLADYLNLIADWTPDQEPSDAVYFHEKCVVYTSLLDLVPSGAQSEKILADYVDFISNSGMYQQSPAEWFAEPHTLLDRAQSDGARQAKILDAYQHSGNPVLVLTVILERTFHRT